jgi:hypothetical protein
MLKDKTKDINHKAVIKIKLSFKSKDKENMLIKKDKNNDYNSIISNFTQF